MRQQRQEPDGSSAAPHGVPARHPHGSVPPPWHSVPMAWHSAPAPRWLSRKEAKSSAPGFGWGDPGDTGDAGDAGDAAPRSPGPFWVPGPTLTPQRAQPAQRHRSAQRRKRRGTCPKAQAEGGGGNTGQPLSPLGMDRWGQSPAPVGAEGLTSMKSWLLAVCRVWLAVSSSSSELSSALAQAASCVCRGQGGSGVTGRPPPLCVCVGGGDTGAHLQLVGAAGTLLLDFGHHAVLQLVQQHVQGLELALQVLLHPRRVVLGAAPRGGGSPGAPPQPPWTPPRGQGERRGYLHVLQHLLEGVDEVLDLLILHGQRGDDLPQRLLPPPPAPSAPGPPPAPHFGAVFSVCPPPQCGWPCGHGGAAP